MQLSQLVTVSQSVAGTRSRKQKIELLANLLGSLRGDDLRIGVPFLSGELRQGKVGLGWAMVRDARTGEFAREASLELADVDRALSEIGEMSGAGSKGRRIDRLRQLLAAATEDEQDFLARLIGGEVRQGALEAVLLEAVARAAELPSDRVRRAVMLGGNLKDVALAALEKGAEGLTPFQLALMRPLQPMLAGTASSTEEALQKLGRAAFEWKLDGARIQVHKRGAEVRAFTRKLHDVTAAVPEVVEVVRQFGPEELLLDGEVIALDSASKPLPFQVTMSRFGRKLNVDVERTKTPLTPFFFDVLQASGESWIDRSSDERSAALAASVPGEFRVPRHVTEDVDEAEAFYAEALDRGHEGVVAKALDGTYEAGRRGGRWLKLKPAHTLDLVVLAAEWGSGRREGWLSNLHLGARDRKTGSFVMLGKTFKGMTDATLEIQTKELLAREVLREGHVVHVKPELVVEIAFDGVQESPQYPGGVALRFARLKRYRSDKQAADADSIDAVLELHQRRSG